MTVTNRFLLDGQSLGNCELKKVGNPESPKNIELPTSTNMQFSLIPHVAEPFHACVIPKQDMQDGMSSAVHIWLIALPCLLRKLSEDWVFLASASGIVKERPRMSSCRGYHFDCEEPTFHARTTQINTWQVRQLELKGGYECRRSNT